MDDHVTHGRLLDELRSTIARLREDIEARSDPALEEVAHALEVVSELLARSLDNCARIEGQEACNG